MKSEQQETTEKASFSSAIRWVSFSKYLTMFARVAISMVMARLLAPSLYGVVAMAYTFFAFAKLLRGFSISEIIVRGDDLDHRFLSTLYWLNLGVCSAATLLLLVLSPVAAQVYSNPLVGWVSAALAICFLLEGMAEVPSSLLEKEMNFRALAIREIAEVTVMGVVCISLAAFGFGVWALIFGTMVSLVVRNFTLYLAKPFHPSFVFDRERCRSCFGFASQMLGIKFIGYLKQNLDKILLGISLGPAALGIYGMAIKLMSLPSEAVSQTVNRTLLALFSKNLHDRTKLAELYLRAIAAITLLSFPLLILLFVLAKHLIPLVLGGDWVGIEPLMPPLLGAAAVSMIGSTRNRLMIAQGEAGCVLHANLLRFILTGSGIAITVRWGLQPLAWAVFISTAIGSYLEHQICFRKWPELSVRHQFMACYPAVAGSVASALAGCTTEYLLDIAFPIDPIPRIAILGTVTVFVYLNTIWMLSAESLKDIAALLPAQIRRTIVDSTRIGKSDRNQLARPLK